jgi:mitochondrial fission protein ELM1
VSSRPVTGPSVWCVADGRAGILNQVKALAAALAEPERAAKLAHMRSDAPSRDVILQPTGWQLLLRPDLWPSPMSALPDDQAKLLTPPWPDVWLAAGRRSIPYSRMMRQLSGGKTLVVQTQNPKVALSPFDLVIPPEHDGVSGANVFPIIGPPTWFSKERIDEARARFGHLLQKPGQKVLVSLGGDSKTHEMTETDTARIEADIRVIAPDRQLWISVSRRTPEHARNRFRSAAADLGAMFWETEQRDGPNPYVAFLSLCDVALATEDSANLIADPAFFAKPVHILRLTGESERFDRLHRGFIGRGAARWFEGALDSWSYAPIREAARAADEIVKQLLTRHPQKN